MCGGNIPTTPTQHSPPNCHGEGGQLVPLLGQMLSIFPAKRHCPEGLDSLAHHGYHHLACFVPSGDFLPLPKVSLSGTPPFSIFLNLP